jgi:hypothetical protein
MVLSWCSHINALYGELPAQRNAQTLAHTNHIGEMPAQRRARRLIYPPARLPAPQNDR